MRKVMLAIAVTVLSSGTAWAQLAERPVRLVLQITVDQLLRLAYRPNGPMVCRGRLRVFLLLHKLPD